MKVRNCIYALCLTLGLFLLAGCSDPVIDKLSEGKALTPEEDKAYQEKKAEYDLEVLKVKVGKLDFEKFRPSSEAEKAAGKRLYMRKKGEVSEFDISPAATEAFGVHEGDLIALPQGDKHKGRKARVVGVYDGHIWFQVEGVKGATFSLGKDKGELVAEGYQLPLGRNSAAAQASTQAAQPAAPQPVPAKVAQPEKVKAVSEAANPETEKQSHVGGKFPPIPPIE